MKSSKKNIILILLLNFYLIYSAEIEKFAYIIGIANWTYKNRHIKPNSLSRAELLKEIIKTLFSETDIDSVISTIKEKLPELKIDEKIESQKNMFLFNLIEIEEIFDCIYEKTKKIDGKLSIQIKELSEKGKYNYYFRLFSLL